MPEPDLSGTLHISAHRAHWKMSCSMTLHRDTAGAFHCSLSVPEVNKSTMNDILLPHGRPATQPPHLKCEPPPVIGLEVWPKGGEH